MVRALGRAERRIAATRYVQGLLLPSSADRFGSTRMSGQRPVRFVRASTERDPPFKFEARPRPRNSKTGLGRRFGFLDGVNFGKRGSAPDDESSSTTTRGKSVSIREKCTC